MLDAKDGNYYIKGFINSTACLSAGKLGASECRALEVYADDKKMTKEIEDHLFYNCGLYPINNKTTSKFILEYIKSMSKLNIVAEWFVNENGKYRDKKILDLYSPNSQRVHSRSLEPYYHYQEAWSLLLEGKRVVTVTPFADSIERQYQKKDLIWKKNPILPDFELDIVKTKFSVGLTEKPEYASWFDELEKLKEEIIKKNPDFVIIGASGWSLPLVAFCSENYIDSIHLGGGLQILFGVKGNRWLTHPIIATFFNEHWVYPSEEETPKHKDKLIGIDSSCYWRK